MTFNKNKTIALAQKYIQKGQIDRAIKEYLKVLDEDKKDIRTRLKVGDLYAKKGDIQEAVKEYKDAAEGYTKDGFFLKAVAVYKNVLKLAPNMIEINLKLGDLYHQLSLLVDAMAQYQIVVNYYDSHGQVKEALDTLKKMVELDPENLTFKINLAELYHKEGHIDQSVKEFEGIAKDLKESNNEEDLIKVYERLLHHQADRHDVLLEVSRCYLNQNQPQRALAKLQVCFKNQPKDPQTLELLAQAFNVLGQPKKAKSVYKELIGIFDEKKDKEGRARVVAELIQIAGDDPDVKEILAGASAQPTAKPSPAAKAIPKPMEAAPVIDVGLSSTEDPMDNFTLDQAAPEVDVSSPMHETDLSSLTSVEGGAPSPLDDGPQIGVMDLEEPAPEPVSEDSGVDLTKALTEIDVYLKYGLADKAKESIDQILLQHPNHFEAKKKLRDFYRLQKNDAKALSILKELIALAKSEGLDAELAQLEKELGGKSGAPDIAAKAPAKPSPIPAVAAPEPMDEIAIDLDVSEMAPVEIEIDAPVGLDQEVLPPEMEPSLDDSTLSSADLSASDLGPELEAFPEEEAGISPEPISPLAPALETDDISSDIDLGEEIVMAPEEEPVLKKSVPAKSPPSPKPQVPQKVTEVADDFEFDLAPEESVSVEAKKLPVAAFEMSKGDGKTIPLEVREEMDEAEFFVQQGLSDEALSIYEDLRHRFPGHGGIAAELDARMAKLGVAINTAPQKPLPKMDSAIAGEKVAEATEGIHEAETASFDLAAELAEELQDFQETEEESLSVVDEQVDFKEVFEEFKKGVASQLGKEDVETHFDLGLAYKEMFLIDDAISEFKVAMADPKRKIDCLTMIGLCQMDKGDFDSAIVSFKEGLAHPSLKPNEIVGLHYELATAYQQKGDFPQALENFNAVKKLDKKFREVETKIKEVKDLSTGKAVSAQGEDVSEDGGEFDLGKSLSMDDDDAPASQDVLDDGSSFETPVGAPQHPLEKTSKKPTKKTPSRMVAELTDDAAFDTPSEASTKDASVLPAAAQKQKEDRESESTPTKKRKSKISYI